MTLPSRWLGWTAATMDLAVAERALHPTFSLSIPTPTSSFPIFDGEISDLLAKISTGQVALSSPSGYSEVGKKQQTPFP
jgi:hypothetical protein